MDCYFKNVVQAILASATLFCAIKDAQAIESGACVARDQLNATLAAENQTKVVGGMQPAVVTIAGQRKLSVIKVIFTSSADRKTGWLLKQDGCTPPNGDPSDATAWRFFMKMKNPKVFDAPNFDTPEKARPKFSFDQAMLDCKLIKPAGSRNPKAYEDAEVNRIRDVSEALAAHALIPLESCVSFDSQLKALANNNSKVMYQAETVLRNDNIGPLLTVVGNADGTFAQFLLTTPTGATVSPEGLGENFYIDGYKDFKIPEKTTAPDAAH